MRTFILVCAIFGLATLTSVHATILFHEEFKSIDHWVPSTHRSDYGKVELSAGKFYADAEKSKGLRLTEDARFYAISTSLPTPVSNEKKDLVVSFSVKHEQGLKCGGGYIKLLPTMDPVTFNGDTKYWLMFGPDRCGGTNKVHIILNYDGVNHEWKKNIRFPEDKLTHVYTLHIAADNTYVLYLDGEERARGELESDWDLLPPRQIADPEDTKPADWVDGPATIPDPADVKPADWENGEPATIPDPDAKRPEDWDEAEDGEWEVPMIPNPKARGEWQPRQIPNPEYKGEWEPRQIPNPAYKPDADLHRTPTPLAHVGIDVWQVESGSIFKDIILGDDVAEVLELVKTTYGSLKTKEAEALSAMDKANEAKKEEEKEEEKEEKGDL